MTSLFFDTNVCIGYIFKWDPWHEKATELISNHIESYFSQTVLDEIFKVFNKLIKEYIKFLEQLNQEILINKKETFYESDLIQLSHKLQIKIENSKNKSIDRERIVMSLWNDKGGYDISKNQLLTYIEDLIFNFKKFSFTRLEKCINQFILHPKTDNYDNLKQIFIKNDIHFPDWQICLDANDLSYQLNNLTFVTADYNLIKSLESIMDKTNITDILKLDKLSIFN
ncbi:MAG: hypothetical protein LBM96_04300 [Methanobrevibacter sp.]|jgi:predicted nucleic acid-binding protein|nr:hypothetical protein [Candidatus Methanoflexus mossambicus]